MGITKYSTLSVCCKEYTFRRKCNQVNNIRIFSELHIHHTYSFSTFMYLLCSSKPVTNVLLFYESEGEVYGTHQLSTSLQK
jgi:hypothetical protein